ncbi:MAG: hypothetical protein N2511_08405 [Thermodesulfovibrionales bacterium]|nr:hypothetical protein [Thermodesulfovibrionales bacterium]
MKRVRFIANYGLPVVAVPFFVLTLILALSAKVEAQSIKPSIEIYSDYTYDLTEGKEDYNSFNIKRAYLGVKGSLTNEDAKEMKINYRLTLDVGDYSDVAAKGTYEVTNVNGKEQVDVKSSKINGLSIAFLKYAYLELEDMGIKGLTLQLGMVPTPWVSFEDKFVGMRWWSPSFTDRAKILNSADKGFNLSYKLPAKYGEVVLSAINGEGYKNIEDTKVKDLLARISIRPLPEMDIVKGLMLHYYIGYGKANTDKTKPDAESVRQRMSFGLSFDSDYFLMLGQYLLTEDGFDSEQTKIAKGAGYSISTRVKLEKLLASNQTGLFFRYDKYDPNTDKEKDSKDTIIVGPYYYFVDEKAALGLNYTREVFEDKDKYKDVSQIILQALVKY